MISRNLIFTLCNDFFDLKNLNDKQYVTFTNLLKRAMHIFKFKNTPDTVDERLLKFIIAIIAINTSAKFHTTSKLAIDPNRTINATPIL